MSKQKIIDALTPELTGWDEKDIERVAVKVNSTIQVAMQRVQSKRKEARKQLMEAVTSQKIIGTMVEWTASTESNLISSIKNRIDRVAATLQTGQKQQEEKMEGPSKRTGQKQTRRIPGAKRKGGGDVRTEKPDPEDK